MKEQKKLDSLKDNFAFLEKQYSKDPLMSILAFWESSGQQYFPTSFGKPNSDNNRPRFEDIEIHNKDPKGTEAFLQDINSAGPTNGDLAARLKEYNKAIQLTSRLLISLSLINS